MRAIAILSLAFAAIAAPALDEDVPSFLADGAKYATDAASCTQDVEESEGYQLT